MGFYPPLTPPPGAVVVAHTTTPVTIISSTTETTLATLAIPTTCNPGDILRVTATGDMINNTGSSVTYTPKLKLDDTIFDGTAMSVSTGTTRRTWSAIFEILVVSSTSQILMYGHMPCGVGGSGVEMQQQSFAIGGAYGTAAEDISVAKNLTLTMQLGTSSANADWVLKAAALTRIPRAIV